MRTLVTAALRLEPLGAAHADAMFEVLRDPLLYAYEDGDPPASADELRERYARLETRRSPDGQQDWLNWVLFVADSAQPIGFVQATVERGRGLAWVAFVLARDCWGRGYARQATQAMLDELAAQHGVQLALATAERANARSIGLLRRLGFSEVTDDEQRSARRVASHDVLMTKAVGIGG